MRIRLVQMNSVVGDITGNLERMIRFIDAARHDDVQAVVFPEMGLAGYPPEDLLFRPSFLSALAEAQEELAGHTQGLLVIAGYAYEGKGLYNAAAVMADGETIARVAKQHLPNYGVFDEHRYFTPGEGTTVLKWGQWTLGISICEDLWYPDGPYLRQARSGANLLINISASPFSRGKSVLRQEMLATRADDAAAYVVWNNLVGAQDELVFDGESAVLSPDGRVLARARAFAEDVLTVDLNHTPSQHRRWIDPRWRLGSLEVRGTLEVIAVPLPSPEDQSGALTCLEPLPETVPSLYQALVLGLKDYVEKNRFGEVVIGLSGGIDSALTAVIAVDALGAGRVHGVFMPSAITSDTSYRDAKQLADNLGIEWREIGIADVMSAFLQELGPHFENRPVDLAEENLQARIRGTLLMGLSNKLGWLVLTTGNKSEMATGYSTLYGDMAGGFAVLKDVLKTEVFRLARYVNEIGGWERIPANVLVKPPSAELRPDQKDEDSLPPYDILDQILKGYIEEDMTPEELVRSGLDPQAVQLAVRLVNVNEYKRRQAPVGIKVTPRAFGRDRRMPITGRFS